ncbi:hypothetical protein COV20_04510 [Candidatus Woesearchaeota archaeon CG10_big_fil_rev_8_21_14_0_10_45_16]|nr:MAG: hypothetical protein COV20_04510 [Candidatus Woesearchaeota archaeon CG10_big_fil_rev_8_21_14_0_10_45_16]
MDLFSITGIIIFIIILVFAGRILSFLLKAVVWFLLISMVLIFAFGVPWQSIVEWVRSVLLYAF